MLKALIFAIVFAGVALAKPPSPSERVATDYLRTFVLLPDRRPVVGGASPFAMLISFSANASYACSAFQIHRERNAGWLMTAAHCIHKQRELRLDVSYVVYRDARGDQQARRIAAGDPVYLGTLPEQPEAARAEFLLDVAIIRIPEAASTELDVIDIRAERNPRGDTYSLAGYEFRDANSGPADAPMRNRNRAVFRLQTFRRIAGVPPIYFRATDNENQREWRRSLKVLLGKDLAHDERFGLFIDGPIQNLSASLSGGLMLRGEDPLGVFHGALRVQTVHRRWRDAPGGQRGLSTFVIEGIRAQAARDRVAVTADNGRVEFDEFRYWSQNNPRTTHNFTLSDTDETALYAAGIAFRPFTQAIRLNFGE